uniref:Uncharacterized protein n=1 Tax=Brugia malayi TaxID=6279 RepID=A8PV60_BRUMA
MAENRNNADLRYTFDVAEVDPKRQSMSCLSIDLSIPVRRKEAMRNRNRASNKPCWETGKTRTQYAHVCSFADALRVYPKCRCAISASGFTTQMVISRSSPGGLVVRDLLAGSGMTAVVA